MVIEFHDMEDHKAGCERLFSRFLSAGYKIEFAENPKLEATVPAAWTGSQIVRIFAT